MIHPEIRGVHVLTDPELVKPRSLNKIIELAIKGGAKVIQLRDKEASDEELMTLGLEIIKLVAGRVVFIVNDRLNVAIKINADGVHVGQKDMSAKNARNIIGPSKILGVSVSTVDQAIKAEMDGADYLGAGPVFSTSTKSDADPPIYLQGLSEIKNAVSIPVIAIGGINVKNAKEVMKFADGLAVISAVLKADNPEQATHQLAIII